jgi:hypothetical protein
VGEYWGLVGEPDAGFIAGLVGLNRGLVGEYCGDAGESRRAPALNTGLDGLYAGELGLYGDFGLNLVTFGSMAGEVGLKEGDVGEYDGDVAP